jgi:hypothetical protein
MTANFAGKELAKSDIQGACLIAEIAGGIVAGVSGTVLLLGINPAALLGLTSITLNLLDDFLGIPLNPKALLFISGIGVGLQAGAGVAAYVGYLQ